MADTGVGEVGDEGYIPTDVVEGQEDALHPPILVPSSQGSEGPTGEVEHLGGTPGSAEPPGAGSVRTEGPVGTFRPDGPCRSLVRRVFSERRSC
eukprot:3836942-Amphidinium_carterae.1